MLFIVGSKNPVKVEAVRSVLEAYPDLEPEVESYHHSGMSGVSDQPMTLQQTSVGSLNRATIAYKSWTRNHPVTAEEVGVGIESGLCEMMPMWPDHTSTYSNVVVCTLYLGHDIYRGHSPTFELPPELVKVIKEDGLEVDKALYKLGWTQDPDIGESRGFIDVLTKGRISRADHIRYAMEMALIPLENNKYFE